MLLQQYETSRIKDIRDVLAHCQGGLDREGDRDKNRPKRIREYVKKTTGIKINGSNEILIEKRFCKHVIRVFKNYFKVYFEGQIDKVYSKSRARE